MTLIFMRDIAFMQ